MSEGEESAPQRLVLRALALVVAAGVIGALTVPLSMLYVGATAWMGGPALLLVTIALIVTIVTGLLYLAASAAPEASRLTSAKGGRICWALLVGGLGAVGWGFSWGVNLEAKLGLDGSPWVWLPLSAVPFALVAGLLLRKWYLATGSLVLILALFIGLLRVLATSGPNDVDARLAATRVDRGQFFVTQIPGYHRVPDQSSFVLELDDPALIPPERHITLTALPDDRAADCAPNPRDSELQGGSCAVERPGLSYWQGVSRHGYFFRKGTMVFEIVGSTAVDRAILRDAVLAARPTAAPDIYTADIPGYSGQETAMPKGMIFSPTDKTQVPYARHVELSVSPIPTADRCATFAQSGFLECVEESTDLHYERLEDKHVYLAQHGAVQVRVLGGLGVDRKLLRDAALSARPATDEELLSMLPPAPKPPRTVVDYLRKIARKLHLD